jgi:hypothetical protein
MLQALFAILLLMGYLQRMGHLVRHRMDWLQLRSKLESRPLQLGLLRQKRLAKLVRQPTLMLGERLKIPRGPRLRGLKGQPGTATPVWRVIW